MTEREMKTLDNLDISKINPDGRYVDVEIPLFFNLNYEQIMYLREKHFDYTIAQNVKGRTREVPEQEEVARRHQEISGKRVDRAPRYNLTRDQKYNTGRHRTKGRITFVPLGKIIVGALVIMLAAGVFYNNFIKLDAADNKVYDNGITVESSAFDDIIASSSAQPDVSSNVDIAGSPYEETGESNIFDEQGDPEFDGSEEVVIEEEQINEELIRELCNIYQVNYDVVYPFIKDLTNNFTSEGYINGCIEGVTCKGVLVEASSERELLVYVVRCIKQLPGQLGVSTDSLYVNNGYESGVDYLSMIDKVCRDLGVNRCLMYAIVQSETSFNSDLFMNSNNPAGLRNDGEWWKFDTKEEGFYELGMEILKYYRKIGISPTQVNSDIIRQIGEIHAPVEDGNANWLPNVLENYEYAMLNEAALFNSPGQSYTH